MTDETLSECCGAPFYEPGWPDNDICSDCKEHSEPSITEDNTNTMTDTRLAAFKQWLDSELAKAERATKGPWIYDPDNKLSGLATYSNAPQMVWGPLGPGYGTVAETCPSGLMAGKDGQQAKDATFIAAARTTCPLALSMLRVTVEALESLANSATSEAIFAESDLGRILDMWGATK